MPVIIGIDRYIHYLLSLVCQAITDEKIQSG